MKLLWSVAFLLTFYLPLSSYSYDDRAQSSFLDSLDRLSLIQKKSALCPAPKYSQSCPPSLSSLVEDEDQDRALVVASNAKTCKKIIANADRTSAESLQNILNRDRFSYLGSFSNSVIKSCTVDKNPNADQKVAKYYYYAARLNAGAMRVAQDRLVTSQLLGNKPPDCPSEGFLQPAFEACLKLQSCSPSAKIEDISKATTQDEELFSKTKSTLQSLPRNCDSAPNCLKQKTALSLVLVGLQERNPWFLDTDFMKAGKNISMQERLRRYLIKSDKVLLDLQHKIETTTTCLSSKEKCDPDDIHDVISLMPPLPSGPSQNRNAKIIESNMASQACLEEFTFERNRTGAILNDSYKNAALTVATMGVGALATGTARLAQASLAARWGRLAAESVNLGVDVYNAALSAKDVYSSCLSEDVDIEFKKLQDLKSCPDGQGSLSPAVRSHGSCLLDSGLGSAAVLGLALSAKQMSGSVRELNQSTANLRRESDLSLSIIEKRSLTPKVLLDMDGNKVSSFETKAISHLPNRFQLLEAQNSESKKITYFQVSEKLSNGEWVRRTQEFQIDELTGAINANFPAGRELFAEIAKEKAGAAHLVFIDVGSLGAVNKTFAGQRASGDRYIKAIADKIIENGEGKVTMARLGGDEFGLIIDEKDPQKVKQILSKIRESIRKDLTGDAKLVFREEKIARAQRYREQAEALKQQNGGELSSQNKEDLRQKIDELAKIQQPDISIGSTQIGQGEDLSVMLERAESQAKEMKIKTVLEFGRSAEKYGSTATPRERPNPMFIADVQEPLASNSWSAKRIDIAPDVKDSSLRDLQVTRVEEVQRFNNLTLAKYSSESNKISYRVERYISDVPGGPKKLASYEIPTRGNTGLLDGAHPESQRLIEDHFKSSPSSTLLMPKLINLAKLNYFSSGTKAGDEVLQAVAEVLQKNTRKGDLTFKLSGSDFLWSIGSLKKSQLQELEKRLNRDLQNNPRVAAVLSQERKVLNDKIKEAKSTNNTSEVNKLNKKLSELSNFNINLSFSSIQREDVSTNASFSEIIKKLESSQ